MSIYNPPLNWTQSIFNPNNFPGLDDNLTQREADLRYLIKVGNDTDYGTLTMRQPIYLANGSVSSPSLSFLNSTSMGLYRIGATSLGVSVNGINKLTIDNTSTTSTNQLIITDGNVANPGMRFTSSNTGWYSSAINTIDLSLNGVQYLSLNTNYSVFLNRVSAPNGTVSDPAFQFNQEASGLYRQSNGNIRMGVQGSDSVGFQSNGILLYGSISGNNVSYSASKLSYYEEYSGSGIWDWGNVNATITYRLTRIGRIVHLQLLDSATFGNAVVATNAVTLRLANAIPVRFRPIHDMSNVGVTVCFDTILANYMYYFISATTNGQIAINRGSTVASTGGVNTYRCVATWTV